ncbi:4-hydroxythreonine-4-phosphate dehydrogenase PdxA [Larsenimonas rhizosphaerae]|uniref:4-hydroxythreonine-4-phosphate dehydrogenase PdxA n=1 Tax=Larsenimonas rhizosphaerae TaxID=2944682 RepID=UPI00203376B9|nr:4-hydroxythreonine-4-phosphate dehydrogenase PdxA [Larsenimonas rhizosphaerae]MCM2130181.1 4-hydroxythreonine-4-phosphate dehydrogenase PdxA [Larsenimonas rhizosphaerae]
MTALRPLLITAGEPAGIGPDLVIDLVCQPERMVSLPPFAVVGDPALFRDRARMLGVQLEIIEVVPGQSITPAPGVLPVRSVPLSAPVVAGQLDRRNAGYVLACLDEGIRACLAGEASAIVTAPLHKGVIIDAGYPRFTGHTEYLRDACGVDDVVMMLATENLRVALVTTHMPLSDVPAAVTADKITSTLRILHRDLVRYFGVSAPRIGVCGLNPHAGEGGHLGREDDDIIAPALTLLREEGMVLSGPLPADTAFTPHHLRDSDAMVAMYHDQGLPVLKYAGFGRAANITLGLPIIRTSVDHGTALDLAGSGRAERGSLDVAIDQALVMARAATQGK